MNSYQPKVSNTQKYEDSQGSYVVIPAKLILIERDIESDSLLTESSIGIISKREGDIIYDDKGLDPIIISETEEMYSGDKAYGGLTDKNEIREIKDDYGGKRPITSGSFHLYKILALPEHFSDKHLQAIIDGKIENGDEVLLACTYSLKEEHKDEEVYIVHQDLQNHITLFPAEQSLEEAATDYPNCASYGDTSQLFSAQKYAFMAGAEWAKNNNY